MSDTTDQSMNNQGTDEAPLNHVLKPVSKLLREDKTGKPDFTYLGDMYPAVARVLARLQMGEVKYSRRNWVHCEDPLTYQQSAIRHFMQYINKQDDEDHLAAATANMLILLDLEEK